MSKIWLLIAAVIVAVLIGAGVYFGLLRSDPPSRPIAATSTQPAAEPVPSRAAPEPTAEDPLIKPEDHILGNPEAPVTIIEYSSLTCPHCARFHAETLPELQSKYIDPGKVKLVFRDFPLDQLALRAAGLAECVPPERYFGFLQVLFEAQGSWAQAEDPLAALSKLGRVGGLAEDQVAACLANEKQMDKIVAERLEGEQKFEIRSTPSFIIAGRTYSGALTIDQLDTILQPLVQ